MSVELEFDVVDLVLTSGGSTRAVDAFVLSVVKMERQIRKLFTHLVYQCEAFGAADVDALRLVLSNNRRVYFEGFVSGIDALLPVPLRQLIGDQYQDAWQNVSAVTPIRNKIFHGQITHMKLPTEDLTVLVRQIRRWCEMVAVAGEAATGYDGFGRNSLRKGRAGLADTYRLKLDSVDDYARFLDVHVARP